MRTIDKNVEEECRNIIYFDLETQKSAQEVGGWSYIDRMKLAIGVTFSTADQQYATFQEADVERLINQLTKADLIVGFNLKGLITLSSVRIRRPTCGSCQLSTCWNMSGVHWDFASVLMRLRRKR